MPDRVVVARRSYFKAGAHPLHLHSFPTRRSSDLARRHRQVQTRLHPTSRHSSRLGKLDEGDRKSTRLNSSHVKISYAVFCLKKKKLTSALTTTNSLQPALVYSV